MTDHTNTNPPGPLEAPSSPSPADAGGAVEVAVPPAGRGHAAIGLIQPKTVANVGAVLRAAHVYGASMVAVQGERCPMKSAQDTTKAWRHMPVLRGDDLFDLIPYGAQPVAVDLVDGAHSLPDFVHPQSAFYIFGPEDGTLSASILERCHYRVMIPTRFCMNLAATVNVVLYDRLAKSISNSRRAAA